MSEFSIIDRFCTGIGAISEHTVIGVGDDAAVINVPSGMQLAISVDSMVEDIHFLPDSAPSDLAYKLLAVNLSDMAAMGADPKWATLALTMPQEDSQWLAAFSASLDVAAKQAGVQLIGGDTTKGPLCLSLNIMGLLPIGQAITRSGASVGNDLWVSNTLGDAALALQALLGQVQLDRQSLSTVSQALHRPVAQVVLGCALRGLASAALDISDGLLADLAHIANSSKVSVEVYQEAIPLSPTYHSYLAAGGSFDSALTGGDDYQLAFTASAENREHVLEMAKTVSIPVTRIGRIIERQTESVVLLAEGKSVKLYPDTGFQHFN